MKKHIGLICMVLAMLMLAPYNTTALQEASGATNKQIRVIESWLFSSNVIYEKVGVSANPIITEGMDPDWKAYDLTDADGNSYVLILRKSDNDFTAVLDSGGNLMGGIIDSSVTPALFENGEYRYSNI